MLLNCYTTPNFNNDVSATKFSSWWAKTEIPEIFQDKYSGQTDFYFHAHKLMGLGIIIHVYQLWQKCWKAVVSIAWRLSDLTFNRRNPGELLWVWTTEKIEISSKLHYKQLRIAGSHIKKQYYQLICTRQPQMNNQTIKTNCMPSPCLSINWVSSHKSCQQRSKQNSLKPLRG